MLRNALAALAVLTLTANASPEPASMAAATPAELPKTLFYPVDIDAAKLFTSAIAQARAENKLAVVVFGADWCHDSRALASLLTSEAFRSEFGGRYAVTLIDVGRPQTGEGRHLELVRSLGVKNLKSTPAMFVLNGEGKVLNGTKDAISWRNAESRGTDKILAWFRGFRKT